MEDKRKIRVSVVGNYLEPLERPLRTDENIILECFINSCSPLAMVGNLDPAYVKYENDINMPMQSLLNLRKNLSSMLSRDKETFNQNYNLQPTGKEVRYLNDTDYIVVMNTSIGYSLFLKNDIVYSDTYTQNAFINDIKGDKSYIRQSFPFFESFNWKYYYEKFIDVIINEYDSDHIIFIKTNSASWYMDAQNICQFENKASQFRNRVEEIDEYFIEKTGCHVIDEQYNFIPAKKEACAFAFSSKSPEFYNRLKDDIVEIIHKKTNLNYENSPGLIKKIINLTMSNRHKNKSSKISQPINLFEKTLRLKLSSDIINKNSANILIIQKDKLSLFDIEERRLDKDNAFFGDILKLHKFLDAKSGFNLSDYTVSLISEKTSLDEIIDFYLLELYTKYFKLNINDIISVYMLYQKSENKEKFKNAVLNIANNSDCLPINASRKFYRKNIEFLKNYPYIQPELIKSCLTDKIFIRLENESYIAIDFSDTDFIKKIDLNITKVLDHMKIIDDGYVCPIESVDALCKSYAFYIEKANRGEGEKPCYITFQDLESFCLSLYYIDYKDILTSENFVISLANDKADISKYKPICDLSFLLKNNTKICVVRSGLTDQICYYTLSQMLGEKNEIYYDDTIYLYLSLLNGFEIKNFAKADISKRLISNLLSKKLLDQINSANKLPELLFKNGLYDTALVSNETSKLDQYKLCSKVYSYTGYSQASMSLINRNIDFKPTFYYALIRPEVFMLEKSFDMSDYIEFPPFDELNQSLADKMLSCDAVVIHIRLGDFVTFGFDVDNGYYIESISKLLEISEYNNKKYFIFSDNIPYVKQHSSEYGFDLLKGSEIYYIDHNKYEESYRDLQLMTMAKIIIASGSGLVRMAAVMSKRCEQVFLWKTEVLELWEKIGKKNKYDIGAYSKSYRLDYKKLAPKSNAVPS